MLVPYRLAAVLVLTFGLAGCASTGDKPPDRAPDRPHDRNGSGGVEGAMTRPLRDLGIMRKPIPAALASAVAAPYAPVDPASCTVLTAEIAGLDAVLGPDLDAKQAKAGGAVEEMLLDAFQGALDLPFRGALRRISGAERRDRARAAAVLAGMVRRAWLKGRAHGAGCVAAPPP